VHIMLKRVKQYNAAGRYQTEAQAKEIDDGIKEMLRKLEIEFHEVIADVEVASRILCKRSSVVFGGLLFSS